MTAGLTGRGPISISLMRTLLPLGCVRLPERDSIATTTTANNKKRIATVANEKAQNVQDVFLNHVRKNKTPVTVFLVNGVKLQGIITWFDNFSVLLRRDGHTQLVYKHAISTVMPGAPIQLFDAAKAEGAAAPARELTPAAGE
jgi:host factor-I protein